MNTLSQTLPIPDFDDSNILCFAGAEEGIYCTIQTILSSNSGYPTAQNNRKAKAPHVIIVTPCYQSLLSIPASLSFTVTTVPLVLATPHEPLPHSNNQTSTSPEWQLNFSMLKEAIKVCVSLLIKCYNYQHFSSPVRRSCWLSTSLTTPPEPSSP